MPHKNGMYYLLLKPLLEICHTLPKIKDSFTLPRLIIQQDINHKANLTLSDKIKVFTKSPFPSIDHRDIAW